MKIIFTALLFLTCALKSLAQLLIDKPWSYKSIIAYSEDPNVFVPIYSSSDDDPQKKIASNVLIFGSDGTYAVLIDNTLTVSGTWEILGNNFIMDKDTSELLHITSGEIKLKSKLNYLGVSGLIETGHLVTTYGPAGPLPVTLVNFHCKRVENQVILSWQTTSEINAARFEVQRSSDSKSFRTIGTIQALGESQAIANYSHIDNKSLNISEVYYRLRLVDRDGSSAFSQIKVVKLDNPSFTLVPYPNPFESELTVKSSLTQNTLLINDSGKTVNKMVLFPGKNKLNISKLPSGVYFLKTEANETIKLIKK